MKKDKNSTTKNKVGYNSKDMHNQLDSNEITNESNHTVNDCSVKDCNAKDCKK